MRRSCWFFVLAMGMASADLRGAERPWLALADPVVEGSWVRPPAEEKAAKPVWGLAEGLRIGIAPLPGPRGLLRVYTPYLGQPDWRMINFIAIEPIIEGQTRRAYSELERSSLAEGTGKVMWSVDHPDDWTPRDPTRPARGAIGGENGVATLTVLIGIEKFRSGAAVFLRLIFREDHPREVEIATFTQPTSAPLSYCVATATMGNYARLRRLQLRTSTVTTQELYSDATFGSVGFATHRRFGLEQLARTEDGAVILAATSDEPDPARSDQKAVAPGWRYIGQPATQYWRCDHLHPSLMALVNARRTYWASNIPIPGGASFENVELIAPFRPGQSWTFGVTKTPTKALMHGESTPDSAKE